MSEWISHWIETGGFFGIAALMLLENLFPPIPSELIMPFAGYLIAQERLGFASVLLAGTFGSVLGALPYYALARRIGMDRTRSLTSRHGRWLGLSPDDLDQAQRRFDRHGWLGVLIARLIPAVRTLISVPAGLARMPLLPFLVFTTLGSTLWNFLLVYGGYALGQEFERIGEWMDPIGAVVLAAIAVAYLWRVIRWEPQSSEAVQASNGN